MARNRNADQAIFASNSWWMGLYTPSLSAFRSADCSVFSSLQPPICPSILAAESRITEGWWVQGLDPPPSPVPIPLAAAFVVQRCLHVYGTPNWYVKFSIMPASHTYELRGDTSFRFPLNYLRVLTHSMTWNDMKGNDIFLALWHMNIRRRTPLYTPIFSCKVLKVSSIMLRENEC